MSLTAAEIAVVIDELGPLWEGATIQKIHLRGPRLALLGLRGREAGSAVLNLSTEPGLSFVCVRPERGAADSEASGFCMLLRRHLKGKRVTGLRQIGGDRVVAVATRAGSLVAEMVGRRGCLLLLDGEDRVVAASPSGLRPGLEPGLPYEPPQAPPTAAPPGRAAAASRLLPGQGANELVCELFAGASADLYEDRLQRAIAKALSSRLKKQRRNLARIQQDLDKASENQALSIHGELLKAHFHRLHKGMTSIVVPNVLSCDPGDGSEQGPEDVEIILDPSLSPADNMSRLFAKSRKARRTLEMATARLEVATAEASALEELKRSLEGAGLEQLEGLASRLELEVQAQPGSPTKRGAKPAPRRAYRTFTSLRGARILVGRSGADNDELTLKVAKAEDLWLHARGQGGSHVILPLGKKQEIDSEDLVDAATLAAHFSQARGEPRVEVIYVKKKHVHKRRGAPRGQVTVAREKVLLLHLEPDRLGRLLRAGARDLSVKGAKL